MQNQRPIEVQPVVLCILDGWGHRRESADNGIALANTPVYDRLLRDEPHALLATSGLAVGLPDGQMGNSEVGHQNIGAGRIVMQDLPRIDAALADGSLAANLRLEQFVERLKDSGGTCHIMGLISPGGVHSHSDHIVALAQIIAGSGVQIWLHCFMDGRDTPPKNGAGYMEELLAGISEYPGISVATVSGRYYAMDRDQRWGRVSKAYDTITSAVGLAANDGLAAIRNSYETKTFDEFIQPTVVTGYDGMRDGDGVLMANFRADRVREILAALVEPDFSGFQRGKVIRFADRLGVVSYSNALDKRIGVLFPPNQLRQTLGEVVAKAGLRQLRIAETEKYAHVTFFLNGGEEAEFAGEDRILVPSPKVTTYDLKPEMSAGEVTDRLVRAIKLRQHHLIVVNYANPDMVGHTGKLSAAIMAVEMIDRCLGRLIDVVRSVGGAMVVAADHGNIEMMRDSDNDGEHTQHTTGPVPVLLVNRKPDQVALRDGSLADLAPTVLDLMGLPRPSEMTGRSLLSSPEQLGGHG